MYKKILLVLIAVLSLPYASATLMRLDFTGTIIGNVPFDGGSPIGQFSGYFLLDSSVPDTNSDPTDGRYDAGFLGGYVNWNGLDLNLTAGSGLIVVRDSDPVFNDVFAVAITGAGTVQDPGFFFQLGDASATVFSDDSFPTELNLVDFDPLEIDNFDATGVFASIGGESFQSSIDSISYTAVPLPGALVLFSSGLLGIAAYSRRRLNSWITHENSFG